MNQDNLPKVKAIGGVALFSGIMIGINGVVGTIDWGALGQWAGAIATVWAVCVALHLERRKRPKLKLQAVLVDQRNTLGLPNPGRVIGIRVRVENAPGRSVANGCRAYLTKLEKCGPLGSETRFFHDSRELHWMHYGPAPHPPDNARPYHSLLPIERPKGSGYDIPPGIVFEVDVAFQIQNNPLLEFIAFPDVFLVDAGTYIAEITVTADEACPVVLPIRFDWVPTIPPLDSNEPVLGVLTLHNPNGGRSTVPRSLGV